MLIPIQILPLPFPPNTHRGTAGITPPPDDALFDVLSLSYPWRDGETRTAGPRAEQLREVQRKYGVEAVKAEVLAIMGDFRRMNLSPHGFARQLDVPPYIVHQWLAARADHDTAQLLHTDASARVSRDHADLTDAIAAIDKKLAGADLGNRVFSQLMTQKTRLMDQRAKLVEKYGLDKFLIDNRDRGTKLLHDAVEEFLTEFRAIFSDDRPDEPKVRARKRKRPASVTT